ncbi:hypothetical protein K493DRAFT_406672 [Basidiobolus meristosporus CBS 931.73]|uniref:PHD-type domain-containing protein n=1 Tax=Basidiobolus meristosporus CBS 931.73 TaxID=1314790 RepID=A0A1Y1YJL4_9FUNG|nr:hypothetical protein K493DRAFT_406672 [Basidiobolus meristosporus CBS 931.73]|eukprot:ORX98210.1 hypothetical protein K493DRAFT_406672 [Basidiobolus meristosporus CBS 931.73]
MPLSPESSVESTNEEEVNSSDESDESCCVICGGEDGSKKNAIVFCDGEGCDIPVHQKCYGIDVVPPGNQKWFCQRCADKIPVDQTIPICCDKTEGAFKRTDIPGSYIHVLCARWNQAIDKSKEPWSVSSLLQESQICYLCEKSSGICTQCCYSKVLENGSIRKCKRWFHVTCAVDAEILVLDGSQGSSKLGLMCREHKEEHKKNRRNNPRKRNSISLETPTKKRKMNHTVNESEGEDNESGSENSDDENEASVDQQEKNDSTSRTSGEESQKSDAELGTNGNSDVDEGKERARKPFRNTLQEILNGKRTTSNVPSTSQAVNGHKHRQPKTTPKLAAKAIKSEPAGNVPPNSLKAPSPKDSARAQGSENLKSKSLPTELAATPLTEANGANVAIKKEVVKQEELDLTTFCEMYLADQQPRLATLESIIHRMKSEPAFSHNGTKSTANPKKPTPSPLRSFGSSVHTNSFTQTQPIGSSDPKQPSQIELMKKVEELKQKLQDSENTFSRFKSIQNSESHRLRTDCEHLSKENQMVKQQLQDVRNDYLKLMNSSRNLRNNLVTIFDYLKLPHQKGPVDSQTVDDRVRELADTIRRTNIDEKKRRDVISKVLKDVDNAK